MKNHKSKMWTAMSGMNDTDDSDRIPDDEASFLLNGYCDPTGKIAKYPGTYPSVLADALGITSSSEKVKVHVANRFRGKTGVQRALSVVGATLLRSGPNNLYDPWMPITFPTETSTPALDRAAAIIFRNRYGYHQNGLDLPFRIKMEEDDDSTATDIAEILGLRPPLVAFKFASKVDGTRFPNSTTTQYVVTYVYGDRGESGPSPPMYLELTSSENFDEVNFQYVPKGPDGVTARRVYRTLIGKGREGTSGEGDRLTGYLPLQVEFFFLTEIDGNTTTTFTDKLDDAKLDFGRRVPPPRPFPPISTYQTVHQDHIVWGNLRDHPWVMGIHSDLANAAVTSATITISNTGNGTITVTNNSGGSTVVSNYKTKSLKEIWIEIQTPNYSSISGWDNGNEYCMRLASGVDWDRTYRFKEVTSRDIFGGENVFWFEAIDDTSDSVVVDGGEYFPNRVMWSNLAFPEEINPLNFVDVSRHDVYPIRGLFRDDYTLGLMTENDIWLITGSLSTNPETFAPDFSLARSQSEHGNFCTRPDSIVQTPQGVIFVAKDGLRIFRGQASRPFARQIRRRLMDRLIPEPRTRDNLTMLYENGKLYVAFAGREVA